MADIVSCMKSYGETAISCVYVSLELNGYCILTGFINGDG